MATNFLWGTVGSALNLLTTELNALASGSSTVLGPEINNITGAFQVGRLHLHLASNSLALTSSSYAKVFFLPSDGGLTYPTFTSGASYKLAESNYLVGTVYLNPATQVANTLDEWLEGVFIPAGKFKTVLVYAGGGAGALPATGNTLDLFPTPTQY